MITDLLKILKIFQKIIKYSSLIKIIYFSMINLSMVLMIKNLRMMNMEMSLLILRLFNKIYRILINLIYSFKIEFFQVENVLSTVNKKKILKRLLKKFRNLKSIMIKQIQILIKIFKVVKRNKRKKLNLKNLAISKGLVVSQVILKI